MGEGATNPPRNGEVARGASRVTEGLLGAHHGKNPSTTGLAVGPPPRSGEDFSHAR